MNDPRDTLAALPRRPDLFLHQLDPVQRRALLVRLDEAEIRAASFLDERVLQGAREGFWAPWTEVQTQAATLPHRTVHAIFHIGHCGSTLLANLLERLPGTLALREPLPLRTLAALHEELPQPTARWSHGQWQAAFATVHTLLGRGFAGTAHVVVKATSSCNDLIEPWLQHDAAARALLLFIDLESYLATILKAPASRADCVQFAPARLGFLHRTLGDDGLRLHALEEAEQIALGWVAELWRFHRSAATAGTRAMALDFAAVLRDVPAALARVAAHFGLPSDARAVLAACSPEVLGRYAKARDHAYGAGDRAADLEESRRRFGPAIAQGLSFAASLLRRHAALVPLAPLLRG